MRASRARLLRRGVKERKRVLTFELFHGLIRRRGLCGEEWVDWSGQLVTRAVVYVRRGASFVFGEKENGGWRRRW